MSVITYIYPLAPEQIGIDRLDDVLSANGFAIIERAVEPRSLPDWSYILLSHQSSKNLRFKLVATKNSKSNIKWIAERFPRDAKVAIVEQAKKYVWCQIVAGRSPDNELLNGIHVFNHFVAVIARLSKAVVDLPENGKLYSSMGFSRYSNSSGSPNRRTK